MLGQLESQGRVVIADFEAGLGTLSRTKPGQLDLLLVVAEPTAKSIEVARRALGIARERGLAKVVLIGNRIDSDEDRALLATAFPDDPITFLPDDPGIRAADARGVAPFDDAPDGSAVRLLRELSSSLILV